MESVHTNNEVLMANYSLTVCVLYQYLSSCFCACVSKACMFVLLSTCLPICLFDSLRVDVPLGPMMASISPALAIPETHLRIVLSLIVTVTSHNTIVPPSFGCSTLPYENDFCLSLIK